jgi:propionyl-CoA synthetase
MRHSSEFTLSDYQVSKLAGALAKIGVSRGDRVLVYMPMIPEAIIAMLATVRLGAVHSVVFGGMFCFDLFHCTLSKQANYTDTKQGNL